MAKIESFEDISSWQQAKQLSIGIYKETESWKDFSLRDQLRRASVSIMNNIAEGFERNTNKDFKNFLFIAKASCAEVRSMLYLARDLQLIESKYCDKFIEESRSISKLISGLIKTL